MATWPRHSAQAAKCDVFKGHTLRQAAPHLSASTERAHGDSTPELFRRKAALRWEYAPSRQTLVIGADRYHPQDA